MESMLPVIFVFIVGLALLLYVVLDGYDLGTGLLLPLATEDEKDIMIASIGPFWDANETWIVLGIGVLLIAFPAAYGVILTELYLPVTIMLMGLILRGVAFDFRVKAGIKKKPMWNKLFFLGSLTASIAQGWMLGHYITGLEENLISYIFSALIAVTLPALYLMLGSAWLLIKTEGELFHKAARWGRNAFWPMVIGLGLISVATPIVSEVIAARWFVLPNIIGLMPIPGVSLLLLAVIYRLLSDRNTFTEANPWIVFAGLVLICLLAATGLAYSIFPDIVIGRMTIWEAASATASLQFVLVGVVITLPVILTYNIMVYRIFRGKATQLSYD
jgi:cytochrome d ubiquinol oxidase subunit II